MWAVSVRSNCMHQYLVAAEHCEDEDGKEHEWFIEKEDESQKKMQETANQHLWKPG